MWGSLPLGAAPEPARAGVAEERVQKDEPRKLVRQESASSFPDLYGDAWRAIIRPPRDVYEDEALGHKDFSLHHRNYRRTDITLQNPRGLRMVCSHFEPTPMQRPKDSMPCVIYLHGNCSSRVEALSVLPVLLPLGITVFCFDFCGSGRSEGEYVSLGYHERDDLATAINYLRQSPGVGTIGVWGRSMGAVTALMHSHRDPTIAGMVLDSPFGSLPDLALELVSRFCAVPLPRWLVSGILGMVRTSIQQRAAFDIYDVAPKQFVSTAFIPAFFTAGSNDNFIPPAHTQELFDLYAGDKNIVFSDGDHNSSRPKFLHDSISIFFLNTLQVDLPNPSPSPPRAPTQRPSRSSESQRRRSTTPRRAVAEQRSSHVRAATEASKRAEEERKELLERKESLEKERKELLESLKAETNLENVELV